MDEKLEGILGEIGSSFHAGRLNCAESVLLAVARYFSKESDAIPALATAFGGGFGGTQQACGAFTGGLMAIGLLYGRQEGGDKAPAYAEAKELLSFFEGRWGAPVCRTLLDLDFSAPGSQEAFRAPGGKHETFCEKMVPEVCRHLVERAQKAGL